MENNILYKNKNIFYRTSGKGNVVLLIHGFGEDGNIWKNLTGELEKNYRIIIPDLPGSGRSEILEGENISIDDYADVIKTILETESPQVPIAIGIERTVCMIGHSMGGYITLAFAKKFPGQLSSSGLFHSSAFADDEQKVQTRLKGIEFIKNNGAYAFLKTSIPNLFADKLHLKEMEQLIEDGKKFSAEALIQYYHAMIKRQDRMDVLKSFTKPILFIIGEKDQAIPLRQSLAQCHVPSLSHIHILPNSAHMGMIEEKEKCKSTINDFIEQFNHNNF